MNMKKSVLAKILTVYFVVSLIVPTNLLFVLEANAQIKEPIIDISPPEIETKESESTLPVFSVTPNESLDHDNDGNNDNPPPKEIKIDDSNNRIEPKSIKKINNDQSPQDGEPTIDNYKYAVANNASKADVNGMTGAFTYSIQLYTPPGRNGMEPNLSLNYSSQTKNELNWVGYGWDISIPSIQRMNKMGVYQSGDNNLYTANTFTSSLNGELATTSTEGVFNAKSDDGSFLKSNFDSTNNKWTVEAKDGTVYKFGHSQEAQIYNPATTTEVYKWMLEEIRDLNGNYITYEYFQDSGYIYPDAITYTNTDTSAGIFSVEFNRELRLDSATSSEASFPMTSNYRINQIVVSVDGDWVRKYDLTYTTGDNGKRSLLSSVTESAQGEDGTTTSLPATTFSYQESTPGWTATTDFALPEKFKNNNKDNGLRVLDLNGDSLPDLIFSKWQTPRKMWLNDGDSWEESSSYNFPDTTFTYSDGSDLGSRFTDLNGDGLVDYTQENWYSRVGFFNHYPDWEFVDWRINPRAAYRLADINGDGLVDNLYSSFCFYLCNDNNESQVWFSSTSLNYGTASGFGAHANEWKLPRVVFEFDGKDLGKRPLPVEFVDVNNDSLTDILSNGDDQELYGTEGVFLNNGRGGWNLENSWVIPNDMGYSGYDWGQQFVDVNSDGLVDIIDGRASGSGSGDRNVYINNGSNWILSSSWHAPESAFPHSGNNGYSTQILDVDGDGVQDIIQRDENAHGRWISNTKPVDILIQINESAGSEVDVTYKSSALYRDSNGDLLSPDLPFTVQVTESVITEDGLGNIASKNEYEYSDGYFSFQNGFDKQFVGFGQMNIKDIEGSVTKTYFHQGNSSNSTQGEYQDHVSKAGKPYRTEQYDNNGNLYSKTINKWESVDRGDEAYFVKLIDSIKFTYDGDSDHKEKATRISYDDSSGNTTSQINFGEVSGNDDGTFTDTGTDKFVTSLSYATSTATSTTNLLSRETTTDNSGNKLREKKIYYDTLSFGDLNKGNSTKEEQWKSGSSYVDVERTFNSYGLVTEEKDPRDKTTTYVYDSFNLYPATTTNPLGHTTEKYYDYSSGQITELKDLNGQTYQTLYDSFDRVLEEKQPSFETGSIGTFSFGGPALETKTKYVYTDDIFPRQVKISNYLSNSLIVDSYFYFDGLNRKIEERIEAEDSNTFKVRDLYYNSRGLLEKESLPAFKTGTSYTGVSNPPPSVLLINYSYDPIGRLTTLTNNVGTTGNTYDDWTVTTTDPEQNIKEFTKDAYENLIEVVEHEGANEYTTSYEWNGNKNLIKITDAEGNVRNFTYDGLGRRLTAQDLHDTGDATYGTWTYTYDDSGNLTSQVDPKNQNVNFTYDNLNRILSEDYAINIGTEIEYGYDNCTKGVGRLCVATSTDAVQKMTWNVIGLPATEIKTIDSTNYTTTYTYDRQGNITKLKVPDNSEVQYTFNTAGLLETIKKKESGGSLVNVVSDLDYSPTDQVTYKVFSNGVESTYTYDSSKLYRLTNIRSILTFLGLRGGGDEGGEKNLLNLPNILKEKDGIFLEERFSANRFLGHRYLEGDIVQYAYRTNIKIDEMPVGSQVLEQTNKENLEIVGEILSERTKYARTFATDKDNVFVSEIISGAPQYYEDPNGEWWQANYATTTLEIFEKYNQGNSREESTFYPDPSDPGSYSIDGFVQHRTGTSGTGVDWSVIQSGAGTESGDSGADDGYVMIEADTTSNKWRIIDRTVRLFNTSSIPDNDTVTSATYYDSTQTKNIYNGGVGGTAYNIYTSNPARDTVLEPGDFDSLGTTPLSTEINYASISGTEGNYNAWQLNNSGLNTISKTEITRLGVRESNFDAPNSAPTWTSAAYENVTFNNSEEDGVSKDPKLVVVHQYIPGNIIQDITYEYDNPGNITEITDISGNDAAKTVIFEYDDLYRLTTASTTAATSTPFRETYSYNSIGNILSKSDQGSYTYAETSYANPHAVTAIGGTSLAYDNNGNLTSFGTNSYTWDFRNRMTSTVNGGGTTNYYYDHTEQRVKKTAGGETTIFPNQYWDKAGATTTRHIYDDKGGLIATIEGNGQATSTYYIHTDHLGGTNVVTDSSTQVVEVTDYLPFGKINTNEAPTGVKTDRKFTSHIYDESADLNYMNARYQDGNIGRFLSQDPSSRDDPEKFLVDPQQFNFYSYGRNNPIRFYDPNGEDVQDVLVSAAVTTAGNVFRTIDGTVNAAFHPIQTARSIPQLPSRFKQEAQQAYGNITSGNDYDRTAGIINSVFLVGSLIAPEARLGKGIFNPSDIGLSKLGEARAIMLDGVQDQKLKNIINQNYREKTTGIGNGSSMDALIRETITGKPTKGIFHYQKIGSELNGINNVLKRNLTNADRAKALYLKNYMESARKIYKGVRIHQ